MKKKILLVEPYCGGSHRAWAGGYATRSGHDVTLLSVVYLLEAKERSLKELTSQEDRLKDLNDGLKQQVEDDTRKAYPVIGQIEKLARELILKKHQKIHVDVGIHFDPCRKTPKVNVFVQFSGLIPWKGKKSKKMMKDIKGTQKEIEGLEKQILEIKKRLEQLPHLERKVKAKVAKVKLDGSEEGRRILSQISRVSLPALPGGKK